MTIPCCRTSADCGLSAQDPSWVFAAWQASRPFGCRGSEGLGGFPSSPGGVTTSGRCPREAESPRAQRAAQGIPAPSSDTGTVTEPIS